VQEYLVENCGLTRPQALKASANISHVKHPTNPDAVVAFLAGLGLSRADVAAVVAKDPRILCASVERTLAPNVLKLIGLGLSRSEVARLVSLGRVQFRTRSVASRVQYFLPIFGSFENLLRIVRRSSYLLSSDVERMAKPNVAFLRECGIDAAGIASLCVAVPRILCTKPEHVRAMAARCEGLGVPLGSGMFRLAMRAVSFLTEDTIAGKVEHLKNTFRWSDAEVGIAVCNFPTVLNLSKDMLRRKSEFLLSEVGLEPAYILHRPVMLGLSLERRLRPRYYVLKFLKENGLLDPDRDYFSAVRLTEKVFMEKFICPHKEAAPYLAEDYAEVCRGEMPTRFRFT
jgi:mTERF domain-containing protein